MKKTTRTPGVNKALAAWDKIAAKATGGWVDIDLVNKLIAEDEAKHGPQHTSPPEP